MKRNYGIDLLRLVLMYMVVVLHVLGHGGVLKAAPELSAPYGSAFLLEGLAFCAVNGYGMITGYVSYGRNPRLAGLTSLWLQAVLYCLGISACVWIVKPQYFSLGILMNQIFPIYRSAYWYLSSYTGLFFLIPILNAGIRTLEEKQARNLTLGSFLVVSVIPTVLNGDPFNLQWGYSTAWLAYLYFLGACIRKFDWGQTITFQKGIALYLASSLMTWSGKLAMDFLTLKVFGECRSYINLYNYTSPTVVLAAAFLLSTFRNLELKPSIQRIVAIFSPAAFGVYLIHEQDYFKSHFIAGRFAWLADLNPFALAIAAVAIAFGIFAACLIADHVRHNIFLRLKIKHRLDQLEGQLTQSIHSKKEETL